MARKVEVQLVDDLDGTRAEQTIEFSLDGVNYQIDLSKKNANRLRGGLEPFVRAARRLGRAPRRRPSTPVRGGPAALGDREHNQAIREWATRKGLDVSPRGRIRRSLVQQYEAQARR